MEDGPQETQSPAQDTTDFKNEAFNHFGIDFSCLSTLTSNGILLVGGSAVKEENLKNAKRPQVGPPARWDRPPVPGCIAA